MLPKEIRIIEGKSWRATAIHPDGWYWIVCIERPADVRRLSISGWADYPEKDLKKVPDSEKR